MKIYQPAPAEIERRIAALREKYYAKGQPEDLTDVTIGVLFVHDDNEPDKPVLTHQGYPAAATIRIVGARDRAQGMPDTQIVIDRATWLSFDAKKQNAVLDHELYHLERKLDKHGAPTYDSHDRPRLTLRKHSWQFGWFDEIAKRHGDNSLERIQARMLLDATSQLYFDFGPESKAA